MTIESLQDPQQTLNADVTADLAARAGCSPGNVAVAVVGGYSVPWVAVRKGTASGASAVVTGTGVDWVSFAPQPVTFGAVSSLVVGGSNVNGSATTAARSDHVHALPAFGSTSGTFCQGNDSRLSDQRTANAWAYNGGTISISGATGPTNGQIPSYNSGSNSIVWVNQTAVVDATASTKGVVQLQGDIGGSASSLTVVRINGSTVPAGGALTTGHVLQVTGVAALGYGFVANANVSTTAAIAVSKLATGTTNYLLTSNGTTNLFSAMTAAMHGQQSDGALHGAASLSTNGFMSSTDKTRADALYAATILTLTNVSSGLPNSYQVGVNATQSNNAMVFGGVAANLADVSVHTVSNSYDGVVTRITAANTVLLSSGGTSAAWGKVTDAYFSGTLSWAKQEHQTTLSGYGITDAVPSSRTLTTTTPLRIGGGNSADLSANRTLSILSASGSNDGSMSSAHYTKLDGLVQAQWIARDLSTNVVDLRKPVAVAGGTGVNLWWDSVAQEVLVQTSFTPPSGTNGKLAKFSGSSTLVDSRIYESGASVAIGSTTADADLAIRGSSGNTQLRLYDTGSEFANWELVSSPISTTGGLFWLYNSKNSAIPFAVRETGYVGINTTDPGSDLDVNGTIRMRGGSPNTGKLLMAQGPLGTAIWTSELSNLTGLTFSASAVGPTITQAGTSEAASNLYIIAQSTTDPMRPGGALWLQAGTGPASTSGNVASGEAGTVQILADGSVGVAAFGKDMMNLKAPLLMHGVASVTAGQESHVLSRLGGFGMFEDVRWFNRSTSAAIPFYLEVPTGMNGSWFATWTIWASNLETMDIRCGSYSRVGGTLTGLAQFDVFNQSGLGYALTVNGDNMRIRITPPTVNPIKWLVRANVVCF